MAKDKGQNKGFRFLSKSNAFNPHKQKQIFVHHYKMHDVKAEDARDAKLADAAYENYLRDPSGARPLDELMAEWDAMDAKREKAKR